MKALSVHAVAHLRARGIDCAASSAAWYVLADFAQHRTTLNKRGITTAAQLCDALLQQAGVAILHDAAFEADEDATHAFVARISLVDFDGERALAQLPPANGPIDEEWLSAQCPRVLDGLERIGKFLISVQNN